MELNSDTNKEPQLERKHIGAGLCDITIAEIPECNLDGGDCADESFKNNTNSTR